MIRPSLVPEVASRFRALSDPSRLALLSALMSGEKTVGELVTLTGRSQPAVSQGLALLIRSRLVGVRREGRLRVHRIVDPSIVRVCETVCAALVDEVEALASSLAREGVSARRKE